MYHAIKNVILSESGHMDQLIFIKMTNQIYNV